LILACEDYLLRRRQPDGRAGRTLISLIILLVIGGVLLLIWTSLPNDDSEVVLPTVRPTIPTQAPPTATTSPTPTISQTSPATPTPSPTANVVIAFSTILPAQPADTPPPSQIAGTAAPELPTLPDPVEIAMSFPIPGEAGIAPTFGRFGGLYDNADLIRAGHIMITVPDSLPFYIDTFEVTNLQLATYLNASNLTASTWNGQPVQWINPDGSLFQDELAIWKVRDQGDILPVHGVSALAARAYCANIGGSLPSLDQWKRAAFWAEGEAGRLYPWGNEPPDQSHANFAGTLPLGGQSLEKGRSWIGAFHLAGNVAEWVQVGENTFGLIGGSFLDDALSFEQAIRTVQIFPPNVAPLGAGFRCIRTTA
jgi:hypothetical protein